MPEKSFEGLTRENKEQAAKYEPGYDWIPGRFGPPPGIPRVKKEQFDKLSDRDYLYAVMKLTQEERESLMISEAERRRTFAVHWPIPSVINGNDLAKEGFYYTGVSDRVQCSFCAGIIRNWERGDIPKVSHKNFFNYCKMVQKKPCHNIPYDPSGLPKELTTEQLSTSGESPQQLNMRDLGIYDNKPKYHMYSVAVKRMETYSRYSRVNPLPASTLCAAGFFYEGPGDKVRCFWCDGALELWSEGDDPMLEHAKWYPGCSYIRQTKGVQYIKEARSKMTADDIATSNSLTYNKSDVSFLDSAASKPTDVTTHYSYNVMVNLGFNHQLVQQAYKYNNDEEYENIQMLIDTCMAIKSANSPSPDSDLELHSAIDFGKAKTPEERVREETAVEAVFRSWRSTIQVGDVSAEDNNNYCLTSEIQSINVEELVKTPEDPSEEESYKLVNAMTCHVCRDGIVGAVLLPCGHFCICQPCSRKSLPSKCPYCRGAVRGACRAYLN